MASEQISAALERNEALVSLELVRDDPIPVHIEHPALADVVHIPERLGSKRHQGADLSHLEAAAAVMDNDETLQPVPKKSRVVSNPRALASTSDVDLVSRYRMLKKHIYSMADDIQARSESERYLPGKLLKQPFSEKLSMFGLVRRELDARGIDFNDSSKWPEVYCA